MLDVRDSLLEQLPDVVIVQRVDHPAPLARAHHKSKMAKQPQLVRDRGGLHSDGVGQVIDRALPRVEVAEDAHPARRCQRLHRVGDHRSKRRVKTLDAGRVRAMAHTADIS